MTEEEAMKKTELEEKKSILQLPKEEHLPYALLTGAHILFATGLLTVWQGLGSTETLTQTIMCVASIAQFLFGGYFLHSYNRWLARNVKR